jgi:secreted trypsin-like serine protease
MRMRLIVLAGAALAGVLFAPSVAVADVSPNIIGGRTVSSAPWSAQIFRAGGSFTCSGSIISAQWVLTAAHCTSNGMTVRVGSVDRGSGTPARVTRFFTSNDLALLRLDRTINTSFVTLASGNPPVGATNSIFGWGMTCRNACQPSSVLKTADVRVTTTNARDAFGGQAIGSTAITGNAWRGDSGGAQFYQGRQVGVASTADGVARQFYGSVAFNRSWIRSTSGV